MENNIENENPTNSRPEIIEGEFEIIESGAESYEKPLEIEYEIQRDEKLVEGLDESLESRYFGENSNEGVVDQRIISYFRDYLGPEETVRRIGLMENEVFSSGLRGPLSFEDVTKKISEGDFEGLVNMMERYEDGYDSYFGERLRGLEATMNLGRFSFEEALKDPDGYSGYEQKRLDAIFKSDNRDRKIKNIIDEINSKFGSKK